MTATVALEGSLALVTGGGSGIGRATCRELAARGARVLVADVDEVGAAATVEACSSLRPAASTVALDVTDRGALDRVAADVARDHGALDVLVNNAGVGLSGRFLDMGPDDWDWILGVNLRAVIDGCAAFGPAMVERGRGHVVNVSSGLAYTPRATESAYVTSKAGVLAFSQCLRADWYRDGVRVSAVCPGVVNTAIIDHGRFLGRRGDPAQREQVTKLFSRGHSPDTVARGIVAAITRDKPVAPVNAESQVGWVLSRLVPTRLAQHVHRLEPGGV